MFAEITENNLQEAVNKVFGKNFTNVSNVELEKFLKKHNAKLKASKVTKTTSTKTTCKCDKLIEILKKKNILLDSEVKYINS